MNAKRKWIAAYALLVAILSCNLPGTPSQSPDLAGTITAQAVVLLQVNNTPASTATPAFTHIPPIQPTDAFTPTPSVPRLSVTAATNCRSGPGIAYDLLYTLQPGQAAEVIGKDLPDDYWIIQMPGGGACWLWGEYATVSGNAAGLPDYPAPPSPTPSLPVAPTGLKLNFHCSLNNSPFLHNDLHVNLSWQDNASNEDGYYVYRDGSLLFTLGPNETTISDDTTMAAVALNGTRPEVTYAVQAFNSAGKSKKITKSISCFQ
jgi:hypothetical protein